MPHHTRECLYCGQQGGSYYKADSEKKYRICWHCLYGKRDEAREVAAGLPAWPGPQPNQAEWMRQQWPDIFREVS